MPRTTADAAMRTAASLVAGAVAAALVRYGLLSHCRLTPEAVEALLQLFVGLTVALAVVLLTAAHAVNAERQDGAPAPAPIPAAAARTAEEADEVVTRTQAVEESPPACLAAARALGTEEVDESGGPSFPPPHFLALSKGDAAKAQRRWDATRRWRREQGVNALLSRPHVNFEAARRAYPMFLHGRGRLGELVMFEMAGKMDMPALKAAGLGVSDLAQHSTYMQEFMWEVLADGDHDARALTVMDVGGLSLRRLSHPDTAELIRTTSGVLDAHYPNRVTRILVVNAPKWLASAWSLLVKLLPPTLRDRVRVLKTLVELHEHIDPACLPLAYGGTDATPPGESAEERLLLEIVTGVRAGRLPPAVAALHDRRRAAEKKEALDGGVLPSVGPTAAGENELQQQEEEQEAPSLLDTPASSVFTTTTSSGGSPVAFPETAQVAWAAAEGEKPQPLPSPPAAAALLTTPAAHPSAHFVRLSWRGRKSKDGEAAVVGTERPRPLSFTFSSCPLEPPNAREGKVTLPSSSQPPLPPHSAGFTGGSKAFWRRRGRFRAPRAAEASSARVVVPTPSAS